MSEEAIEQVDQPVGTLMETPSEVAQGGSGNDFLDMIPEELRGHPSISPIKDVENLARSYVNAQKLIGADKIPMPTNPTDEDLDRIYGRLGRPETSDGYNLAVDGNVITEDIANSYRDVAHQLRLTPDQANGVLEYYKSVSQGSEEEFTQRNQQQREQIETDLKREWGQAYEQKISAAGKVIAEFANPEILEMRLEDGTPVGNHPDFIKAFANIADFRQSVTSEDTISNASANRAMTPSDAQAEISAIMASPDYTNRRDYGARQRAIERVSELYGMIHG
tara:strand:+ start:48 stop:884 length:837 start_codon:yes stop_codon:yes gene_type:complete